ncbi:Dysferlin [Sarracenia purpurea var. burkii]
MLDFPLIPPDSLAMTPPDFPGLSLRLPCLSFSSPSSSPSSSSSSSSSSSFSAIVWPRKSGNRLIVSTSGAVYLALRGVVFQPFEEVKKEELMVPIASNVSHTRQRYEDLCEAAINEQIK